MKQTTLDQKEAVRRSRNIRSSRSNADVKCPSLAPECRRPAAVRQAVAQLHERWRAERLLQARGPARPEDHLWKVRTHSLHRRGRLGSSRARGSENRQSTGITRCPNVPPRPASRPGGRAPARPAQGQQERDAGRPRHHERGARGQARADPQGTRRGGHAPRLGVRLQEIRVPPGRVLKRVLGTAVFRARGIPKVSFPRQYASPGADTTASRRPGLRAEVTRIRRLAAMARSLPLSTAAGHVSGRPSRRGT